MRKNIKFLMICAAAAGAGFILAAAGNLAGGKVYGLQINGDGIQVYAPLLDEKKETERITQKEDEKLEPFDAVEIEGEYENIRIESSDSDEYSLSYCFVQDHPLKTEIKDGRLILKHESRYAAGIKNLNFTWFSLGRETDTEKITEYLTIRLPREAKLKSAEITSDSGDTVCENIQADSIRIKSDYGKAELINVRAEDMELLLDSGDLRMENAAAGTCRVQNDYGDASFYNVSFTGGMDIRMDSGNIRCLNSALGSLNIVSSYGDLDMQESEAGNVQMSFENGKVKCQGTDMDSLDITNSYGDLDVQQSGLGTLQVSLENGKCSMKQVLFDSCMISTEYGDVGLELKKPVTDYAYQLSTEYGTIKINGKNMGESYVSLDEGKKNPIEIKCESGDIVIQ